MLSTLHRLIDMREKIEAVYTFCPSGTCEFRETDMNAFKFTEECKIWSISQRLIINGVYSVEIN